MPDNARSGFSCEVTRVCPFRIERISNLPSCCRTANSSFSIMRPLASLEKSRCQRSFCPARSRRLTENFPSANCHTKTWPADVVTRFSLGGMGRVPSAAPSWGLKTIAFSESNGATKRCWRLPNRSQLAGKPVRVQVTAPVSKSAQINCRPLIK